MIRVEHTRGPWNAALWSRTVWASIDGRPVRIVSGIADAEGRHTSPEARANAILIAASPALLSALEDLVERFAHSNGNGNGRPLNGKRHALQRARRAIALATELRS